ncbi:putative leader peptide [Streptomyces phaeolivaceus]|nr:putative leader peptide [Streptomyces phaeolivaceus]
MRYSAISGPSGTVAAAHSRFSRRRHIDLQRITSCLCRG